MTDTTEATVPSRRYVATWNETDPECHRLPIIVVWPDDGRPHAVSAW
jgi:hypothetical protein